MPSYSFPLYPITDVFTLMLVSLQSQKKVTFVFVSGKRRGWRKGRSKGKKCARKYVPAKNMSSPISLASTASHGH